MTAAAPAYTGRHRRTGGPKHRAPVVVDMCRNAAGGVDCSWCAGYVPRHRKPIEAVRPSALSYPRAHRSQP